MIGMGKKYRKRNEECKRVKSRDEGEVLGLLKTEKGGKRAKVMTEARK